MSGLSKPQIDFFRTEGYLVLHELFGEEDLQPAIDDINRAIDEKSAELVRSHATDLPKARPTWRLPRENCVRWSVSVALCRKAERCC